MTLLKPPPLTTFELNRHQIVLLARSKPARFMSPFAGLLALAVCSSAWSDTSAIASNRQQTRTLQGEYLTGSASGGSQEGDGMALRFTERLSDGLSDKNTSLEWRRQSRLNTSGQQLAGQQTRSIGHGRSITVGANASDTFLFPSWGLTSVVEQRWANPWLTATRAGLTYQALKNNQHQTSVLLEQTGNIGATTVWQIGRQQGIASPASRSFHSQFVAVQYVSPHNWRGLLRRQWSREASALLVDGSNAQGFNSQSLRASIGLKWVPDGWISVFHERYDTPFYERQQTGISVEQSW